MLYNLRIETQRIFLRKMQKVVLSSDLNNARSVKVLCQAETRAIISEGQYVFQLHSVLF